MRKQTKFAAVLSAAALLAIGASMTSFAAWEEADGTWVWLDKDGERATETWKKSGNQYFWLDENGEMATDAVIEDGDDTYYVDENGARVTNQWVAVQNDDMCEEDIDTVYFYFGSTGKAYKDTNSTNGRKSIEGKTYIFDTEGHMLSGWRSYDGNTYYLGEENEGWAYTGWNYLEIDDEFISGDYDDEEWFWFNSVGKANVNKRAYIGKAYYSFDSQGVMMNKWLVGTPATTSPSAAYYDEEIGNQATGWVRTHAVDDVDKNNDPYWFYLNAKGEPFNFDGAASGVNASKPDITSLAVKMKNGSEVDKAEEDEYAAKVIKNKTYLFNDKGQMQTGVFFLEGVKRDGGSSTVLGTPANSSLLGATRSGGFYYFNKADGSVNGQMMTGRQTVTYDGDSYYYYFKSTGDAYTNYIVDGSLYNQFGVRINADDGNMVYVPSANGIGTDGGNGTADAIYVKVGSKVSTQSNAQPVIISKSGKVKKSGTVTIDGQKWSVNNYLATPVNAN